MFLMRQLRIGPTVYNTSKIWLLNINQTILLHGNTKRTIDENSNAASELSNNNVNFLFYNLCFFFKSFNFDKFFIRTKEIKEIRL